MAVPLFDTASPLAPLRATIMERIAAVVTSGQFVLGPEVRPALPVTDALGAENIVLPISPVFGADQAREVVAAIARAIA